jgi:subtilisin family serine protease/subtilase family serine protease
MRTKSLGVTILLGVLALTARPEMQGRGAGPRGIERINGRAAAGGEVLVKLRDGASVGQLAAIEALSDADSVMPVGRGGARRLRSRSHTAEALLRILNAHPSVEYAEPNYIVHTLAEPTDPQFPQLWGLRNVGQAVNGGAAGQPGADVRASQAWDIGVGSKAHVVAVIDTGIDYTHPDLVANIWSAPAAFTVTIAGTSITCPAGSHGFNAINLTCNPMDDHHHGTHVSGTIGASANNGIGVAGVNWVADIMGIKFLGPDGSGTIADAINGIDFVIQAKHAFAATGGANVRVLSNSWGGRDFSQALENEIALANGEEMLFVAAAGNDGFSNDILPLYPASYEVPNVVAVAATTNTDARAWFSNYGAETVHLGAPGVDILSTTPGNTYAYFNGTSMATPHVSGAAALVLSRCALDTAQLKSTLLATVQPIAALAGITTTGGRLDVNSAMQSCVAPPGTPTNLTALAADHRVTLSWDSVVGATSFTVERALAAGGPYTPIASDISLRTYVDTNVVNGTTYFYVVSATNIVGDSGRSNEASATPKAPSDLVVSAMTVPSGGGGATLTVSETTRNQGSVTSAPTTTRFYLSVNSFLDAADTVLAGVHAVPPLPPGGTSVASVPLDIPASVAAGTYYIVAKADADAVEAETSETNNTASRLFYAGPDLTVSSLVAPSTAGAGGTISVTEVTKNQGGIASATSTTRFYLSANISLDPGDAQLSGARAVDPLSPGQTSSGPTTLTIPAGTPTGGQYLIAKADADAGVSEALETNNTTFRLILIGGDLKISSVTAPAKAGSGSTIAITDTTANQGGGAVPGSITRFYLSTNATLDAADQPFPGGRTVPDLDPGEISTGTTTTTVPEGLTVGTYYVIAKADGDGTVGETTESNNTMARSISIGGDLIVSTLTVPTKAGAGGTIVVSDTVLNQGGGSVGQSVTRFYLSPNSSWDVTDPALTGSRIVPGLSASENNTGTSTLPIPSTVVPGLYYLIARANADATAPETSFTNNTLGKSITIGPDLTISSMTVPFSIVAGSSVTVSDTVLNQGAGGAGASRMRFYLSTNLVLDAADVQLSGSRAVPDLAAGVSNTGSTTIVIPVGTTPGNYFVLGKADGDGEVAEAQEGNNVTARAVQVKAS